MIDGIDPDGDTIKVNWRRTGVHATTGKEVTIKLFGIFKYTHERIQEVCNPVMPLP